MLLLRIFSKKIAMLMSCLSKMPCSLMMAGRCRQRSCRLLACIHPGQGAYVAVGSTRGGNAVHIVLRLLDWAGARCQDVRAKMPVGGEQESEARRCDALGRLPDPQALLAEAYFAHASQGIDCKLPVACSFADDSRRKVQRQDCSRFGLHASVPGQSFERD